MNWRKVHGYSRNMKHVFKNKFMIFGWEGSITNVINREWLTIAYYDLIWTFVLWLNRKIAKISSEVIWST